MATLAELLRNPNSYQNEEGKVFVGDSESGQWVTPDAPEASTWNPESGQLTLMKYDINNRDPYNEAAPEKVSYDISKDAVNFIPSYGSDNITPAGGQYILKDGSTVSVDQYGVVNNATPGKQDYTLNEQGYYQPTGENLTWKGDVNMLYKKINGVDVQVPNIYHKGGYKDEQGNLRVDANGVPVALAPNYMDSGRGKSTMDDVGKGAVIAALAAMTGYGAYGAMGAGAGAAEGAGALTSAEIMGGAGGSFVPAAGSGASFSVAPGAAYGVAGAGAAEGAGSAINPATGLSWEATGSGYAGNGVPLTEAEFAAQAGTGGYTVKDAYNGYKMANALKNVLGGSGTSQQTGGYGIGTGSNWNYQNQPFLSNPQEKSIYATTGLDVSGNQATPLDVTRGGNLLANLLRR